MTPIMRDSARCLLALVDDADKGIAITPQTWADTISGYVWTQVEAETGYSLASARFWLQSRRPDKVSEARQAIAIANMHSLKLAGMRRDEIRAECVRVIALAEAA